MIPSADLIAGIVAFIFTVLIFSYLIGDNPFYRIATYFFVGVSAGYIASVVFWQVLMPRLFIPLMSGMPNEKILALAPLILVILILMKASPRLSKLGSPAMAYLVGASAAVVIGGAVIGTLLPQMLATVNFFDLSAAASQNIPVVEIIFNGSFILVGAVTSLAYFHFGARPLQNGTIRRMRLVELLAWFGRIFIAITLGVIFAGVYSAALTAFIERINFLINFLMTFFGP
ncbi:MAG: hypothetical protein MUO77_21085 [Anaerolineales bacterium]|nr:hypothetical protein [Anaerolineales bacterium]